MTARGAGVSSPTGAASPSVPAGGRARAARSISRPRRLATGCRSAEPAGGDTMVATRSGARNQRSAGSRPMTASLANGPSTSTSITRGREFLAAVCTRRPDRQNDVQRLLLGVPANGPFRPRHAWRDFRAQRFHWYTSVPRCWAGDNEPNFGDGNGLPSVIVAGLSAAMSGFSMWGHDSAATRTPTSRLISPAPVHALDAFGCFTPIMQMHRQVAQLGRDDPTDLRQYPWGYGEPP